MSGIDGEDVELTFGVQDECDTGEHWIWSPILWSVHYVDVDGEV